MSLTQILRNDDSNELCVSTIKFEGKQNMHRLKEQTNNNNNGKSIK